MSPTVARLYRYPIKGLNAEALSEARVLAGRGLPLDRAFGLALSTTDVDPLRPAWLSKSHFVTLMRHERLAALSVCYDSATHILTVHRSGRKVAQGIINTPIGRAMIEAFFRAYLKNELVAPVRLIGSEDGAMLSDLPEPGLSIIGLATLRDLERVVGRQLDPLRFRANVYIDGTEPWEEFSWIDRDVDIGSARVHVTERIERCAATNVEPGSGARDLNIPRSLMGGFGHADCGVFAQVVTAGTITSGSPITLVEKP